MEACNLGSINLARFAIETDEGPAVDYTELKEVVWESVHFLDNTIDMSQYPLPEIGDMVRGNRKIGLGVMGFADLLYQLEIPYDSEKALETAEAVMAFIQKESHRASRQLAEERGVFGNFDKSVFKGREKTFLSERHYHHHCAHRHIEHHRRMFQRYRAAVRPQFCQKCHG